MTQQRKFRCIDLSDFDKRKDTIVKDIMTASKENGFFYVSNHGIDSNEVQDMFNTGKQFFALPDNIKSKYPLDVPRNAGWEKLSQIRPQTGLPDLKESMQLTFHHIPDLWPTEDVPEFKPKVEKFMKQCNDLSQKILECLAIGLDFPHDYFTRCHDITQPDALNSLRFQHYFDLKERNHEFSNDHYYRTGPHTDPDTITLLFHPNKNNQQHHYKGLEACQGREDVTTFVQGSNWVPIVPKEDEIICNIGDMMMRWSDDVLKSNFYRVSRPSLDDEDLSSHYNITYFVQANKSAIIQGRTKYNDPLTAGDFLRQAMERNHQRVKKLIDQRNAELYRKQQGQLHNNNNKRNHSRTSSFSEQQPKRRTIIAPVLAI